MVTTVPDNQHALQRRVFPSWSVALPVYMEETFLTDGAGYWHAWSHDRSISLTSFVLTDERGDPVPAFDILERMTPIDGEAVPRPNELPGWARWITLPEGSLADHAISGILTVDGKVLLITVTSEDRDWSQRVWRSIKHHDDSRRYGSSLDTDKLYSGYENGRVGTRRRLRRG